MRSAKIQQYRDILLATRDRLTGNVNHVVEAIQEDINPSGNLSAAPLHLADVATESLDADVQVLEAEYGMLDEITAALDRIDQGTFGACQECGRQIGEERLDAIPYASLCIDCARANDQTAED